MGIPEAKGTDLPNDIKTVAVIGAGMSGVLCAAHLIHHSLDVTVFERGSTPGGVWHFDCESAPESSSQYPTEEPESPGEADGFSPPGPCYAGLRCLVPTSVDRSSLSDWPDGTPEFVGHDVVEGYIRDTAVRWGVDERTRYNTRVDSVRKAAGERRWTVRTTASCSSGNLQSTTQYFDAVIVAAGHYHQPRIPDIPGLHDIKQAFTDRVTHAKGYRTPQSYYRKTVLLVGGGISSLDIARELAPHASKIYQSSRGSKRDLAAGLLPGNAERIGAVQSFRISFGKTSVTTSDGHTINDIDAVILATGYITSYPFLAPPLQIPSAHQTQVNYDTIVTKDGFLAQNLHRDLFYIPDPSLIFMGTPYRVPSFVLFDLQAQVVSRVLSGKAQLPSHVHIVGDWERRKKNGETTQPPIDRFHEIVPAEKMVAYMDGLREWMNEDAKSMEWEEVPRWPPGDGDWVGKYQGFLDMLEREDVLSLPLEERWLK